MPVLRRQLHDSADRARVPLSEQDDCYMSLDDAAPQAATAPATAALHSITHRGPMDGKSVSHLRFPLRLQLCHRTHPRRPDLSKHRRHQHQPHNQRDQSGGHLTMHPFLRSRFGQSWILLSTLIPTRSPWPRECCCSSPRVCERVGEPVAEMLSIHVLTHPRIPAAIRVALLGSLVCSLQTSDRP